MNVPVRFRLTDVLVVAAWSGFGFGLIEGFLLDISRAWPKVLAPYKASAHLLWIAPAVDVIVFAAAGVALWVVLRWLRDRIGPKTLLIVFAFFAAAGTATVGVTLNVLHPASVAVLAAGAAVAVWRRISGREESVAAYLRRRVWMIAALLVVLGAGVQAYEMMSEAARYRALGPVQAGAR